MFNNEHAKLVLVKGMIANSLLGEIPNADNQAAGWELILKLSYVKKSCNKSTLKMKVYIALFLYVTAVLSVQFLKTIKTRSKRSHITSPRIKLAAIIRCLIMSTLNSCS